MYRFDLFFSKIYKSRKNKSLFILYIAGIFLAISSALPAYINSSLIENSVAVEYVGLFFVVANLLTFVSMLFFPQTIKRFGNLASAKAMIFINLVSLFFLAMNPSAFWLFIFFVSMWVSSNLIWVNMDIFVESFTKNTNTGKTRAIYFTFMNLGWIVSPFLASRLVVADDRYGPVYLASASILLVFYAIIVFNRKKVHRKVRFEALKIRETIKIFWKDLNLRGIYFVSFFLNLFFNSAVVFIPIYLHTNLGFEWSTLGIMFSIMLIPFILIEIPAGIIADKYLGEKEMMFAGLFILMSALLMFFFVKSTNPFVWGAILFFSRIGAALVEEMREASFFKIVDVKHVSQINFLRTSYPLGYLVGSGLGVLVLSFFPVQYLFLFLAIIFLYSFYFVYIIKDSK